MLNSHGVFDLCMVCPYFRVTIRMGVKMKVIFVSSDPYCTRHDENMCVDEIQKVYPIERWELSKLYGWENYTIAQRAENVILIESMNDFEQRLSAQEGKVVIISLILLPQLSVITDVLRKKYIPLIYIAKEDLGDWIVRQGAKGHYNIFSLRDIKRMMQNNRYIWGIYSYFRFKNAKYDFYMGTCNFLPKKNKEFYRIHHVVYEDYLQAKDSIPIVEGKYIVFVDSAYIHHPSYAGKEDSLNGAEYLKTINRYFDLLEQKFNMPVIIAAHPKTKYQSVDFGGRSIFLLQTPVLLQHATYVVGHYSTSLYQAILLKKPMAIMTSKTILSSVTKWIELGGMKIAEIIHANIVDIEREELPRFAMDDSAYQQFIDNYLVVTESKNLSNAELLLEFLKKIN